MNLAKLSEAKIIKLQQLSSFTLERSKASFSVRFNVCSAMHINICTALLRCSLVETAVVVL